SLAKISGSQNVARAGLTDHDAGASPKVLCKVQGLAGQVAEARTALQQGQHLNSEHTPVGSRSIFPTLLHLNLHIPFPVRAGNRQWIKRR
ncbi:unnamed protein product, partial [Ectocarpus sp. 12 AP-2014]